MFDQKQREKHVLGFVLTAVIALAALFITYFFGTSIQYITPIFMASGFVLGFITLVFKCQTACMRASFIIVVVEGTIILSNIDYGGILLDATIISCFTMFGSYLGATAAVLVSMPIEKRVAVE